MAVLLNGTNGLIQAYDYQTPTTGFSYTFTAGTQTLVMNPAGTLATGTITMPASPSDGMTITISSTQQITALTLSGNAGQTIVGGVNSLAATQAVSFIYRSANTSWFPMTTQVAEGTGPAFGAYSNTNQSIGAGTFTKVLFQTEDFDTNNNFASSTFTPNVAGYYQFNSVIYNAGPSNGVISIFKNGTEHKRGVQAAGTTLQGATVSSIVYCNGTTDYIEIYAYAAGAFTIYAGGTLQTWFNGAMVRGA